MPSDRQVAMAMIQSHWSEHGSASNADGPRRPGAQEGPPELHELWRDFNQRLERLLGRGGGDGKGGGDGGGPVRDARQAGIGVLVVLAAIFVIWMCTGIYTVQEGQVGVVSTFGRYDSTTPPGLRWRAPWPLQANEIVDVFTQRKVDIGMRGGA